MKKRFNELLELPFSEKCDKFMQKFFYFLIGFGALYFSAQMIRFFIAKGGN